MGMLQTTPRLALENILFATDFSSTSSRAFAYTLALARWYGASICMVHAVAPEPHYSVPLEPVPADLDPMWQQARQKMAEYEAKHAFGEIAHQTKVEHGYPWDVVSRIMRQEHIDLLVLGTHGRTGIRKVVLGSQAEIMFRQASCPVLTVGPHVDPVVTDTWTPRTILFATDFSATSLHALPFALSVAEEAQARLIFTHLMPLVPMDRKDDAEADALTKLRNLVPPDAEQWCQPEFVVRVAFPQEGILNLAQERTVDLIVLGVRKKPVPSASSHSPWATASEVVSRASCPVLTVRG